MADQVVYDVRGGVARATINRPERRNALTWAAVRELRRAAAAARDDPAVRVLVLAGAGDAAFCAGADLADLADMADMARAPSPASGPAGRHGRAPRVLAGQHPPAGVRGRKGADSAALAGRTRQAGASAQEPAGGVLAAHDERGELARLFADLWALGKPTIARVQGFALAGGFGLALACDFVVAADDAQFGAPEIDLGLWPFMATVPLVRSMPPKKALELMLTGRRVGAAEAERIGFVNRVVPVSALDAAVDELAATLAAKPPGAVKLGRDSFYGAWDRSAEDALAYLHPLLTLATLTDEAREGIAGFEERRGER